MVPDGYLSVWNVLTWTLPVRQVARPQGLRCARAQPAHPWHGMPDDENPLRDKVGRQLEHHRGAGTAEGCHGTGAESECVSYVHHVHGRRADVHPVGSIVLQL